MNEKYVVSSNQRVIPDSSITLTPAEVRALGTVLLYLREDFHDKHPAACAGMLLQAYKRAYACADCGAGPKDECKHPYLCVALEKTASETPAPQAPIAKITVREGPAHYAPDDVCVSLYAPGLPPGEHDVYLDPAAPGIRSVETSDCMIGVGDGSGNLFVHGSYDAVKRVQSMILELERLQSALYWALGERDDFPSREDGEGAFWWRTELRRRAELPVEAASPQHKGWCASINPDPCNCRVAPKAASDWCPHYDLPIVNQPGCPDCAYEKRSGSPLEPAGKLSASEAASFDKTLARSPRRMEPTAGNHAANCGAHDGKRCDCHIQGYRDATGELVLPHENGEDKHGR